MKMDRKATHLRKQGSATQLIVDGPDEFVGAGSGFRVAFRPCGSETGKVGIGSVDEGEFRGGNWIAGRRLNGDENDQGNRWRFTDKKLQIERCQVYQYE